MSIILSAEDARMVEEIYIDRLGFRIKEELGRGTFCAAYSIDYHGRPAVVKTVNRMLTQIADGNYAMHRTTLQQKIEHLENELGILQAAQGIEGIPEFYAAHSEKGGLLTAVLNALKGDEFCRDTEVAVIRQHIQGDAWKPGTALSEYARASLGCTVHAMHEAGIARLDLRKGNIIITPKDAAYLVDLGHAERFDRRDNEFEECVSWDYKCLNELFKGGRHETFH